MPLVSVLVPVFNRESLIEKTLRSAMAQTVEDIEIVVVDNQSTDNTYSVVASLRDQDKRIRLYQNKINVGPVRNWIACAELATASYSKLLFSDDLVAPTYIERTLPHIISPDCGLVYTNALVGSEDWQGSRWYYAFDGDCRFNRDFFLRATTAIRNFSPDSPGAALLRTADLQKHLRTELPGIEGYDFAGSGAGVDWLVYVLTALNYRYITCVCEPLVFFRAHPQSISVANENNLVPQGYSLARKWFAQAVKGL